MESKRKRPKPEKTKIKVELTPEQIAAKRQARLEWRRAYYAKHKDETNAKLRAKRASSPKQEKTRPSWREKNPEKARERDRLRYRLNAEAMRASERERARKRREEDPERVRLTHLKWRQSSPEKARGIWMRRYARQKSAEAAIEPLTLADIIARDGLNCYICGTQTNPDAHRLSPIKAEVEHVIPLISGGKHEASNLRCACARCNRLKGSRRTPEDVRALLCAEAS